MRAPQQRGADVGDDGEIVESRNASKDQSSSGLSSGGVTASSKACQGSVASTSVFCLGDRRPQ